MDWAYRRFLLASGSPLATAFVVTGPPGVITGVPFNITVIAIGAGGARASGYTGTVTFTSSDGSATLPANTTLTAGAGIFSVTLVATGLQTITATDTLTASITGNAVVNVSAASTGESNQSQYLLAPNLNDKMYVF